MKITGTSPLLKITNLTKSYQSGDTTINALDNISLTIHQGEFVAVMGQSGSGKSTLMNIVGCLDRPTSGTYEVLGKNVSHLDKDELAELRRETFGFVFQRYNLIHTMTALGNVETPAIYGGIPKVERLKRAQSLLEKLRLGERSSHHPSQLSGGQQQRVAIARALINNPPVILADEPTGALDSQSGVEVMKLLNDLHAEGRTIILITHDEKVANFAHRVIKISDGRILSDVQNVPDSAKVTFIKEDKHAHASFLDISETIAMAFHSLRTNLFRTCLTLLGIIIGVCAVVVMLAVGSGSKQKVLDQITAMGTNILSVRPGAPGIRGTGDIVTLVPADMEALLKIQNIEAAVPERSGRFTVRYLNKDYQTTVQGTSAAMPFVRDWQIADRQFFNLKDIQSYAPVAVIGETVKNLLFGERESAVGKYLLIKNVPFQVVGVLGTKGANPMGNDQDDVIMVPYTTGFVRLFGRPYLNGITVKIIDLTQIDETQEAITTIIKERHRTEDFSIRNMASMLATATETQNTLTIMLGAVAAVSLLVGGIGVMNIMLVSVTERTKEIGVRIATGARMRDILYQFNIEAAVVCTIGGLTGIAIGLFTIYILQLFEVSAMYSFFPPFIAFCCAFFTGLIFGFIPAYKAAKLDPVVALSSE
jgi:macrolide transport system ATP-binding/permease protein